MRAAFAAIVFKHVRKQKFKKSFNIVLLHFSGRMEACAKENVSIRILWRVSLIAEVQYRRNSV